MFGSPIRALDPTQPASSFLRTHFTTDSGLPGAVVDQAVQTPNGFLWLITNGINLVRFDGKTFYRFDKPRARALALAPNGDLWVGTYEGIVHIPSSAFDQFTLTGLTTYEPGPGKAREISSLRFSKSGVLWIATQAGLFRYERDQFVAVGPQGMTRQMEESPDGHLFVTNDHGFMEIFDSQVIPHPELAERLGVIDKDIFHVLKDSRGNTWYSTAHGVIRETGGRIERLATPLGRGAFRAYEDPQGNVWIGNDDGLFRATANGLELVEKMKARSIYSDRDGNLWAGTNGDGVYRFKDRVVRMFTTADGLPNDLLMTVLATQDGSVWTGANCGGISRFDGTRFQTYNEKNGLLNTCVWAIAEDANRDLWIGTWGGGAYRFHNGTFTQYSKGQGMADDRVTSIVAAPDGTIWFGTRGGVTRLKDGQFRTFTTTDGLSGNSIFRLFQDRAGVVWVGTRGGLDRLVGERFENFAAAPKSLVIPFGDDRDGGFFVAHDTDSVTLRFAKDRIDTIKELATAFDVIETAQGELWFGGNAITRVPPGVFIGSRQHDEPLDFEQFSTDDGLATGRASSPGRALAMTSDGKLWVATAKGLAVFDLRRLSITNARPSIYLSDVTIGRDKQRPAGEIILPPGTNHVRIDFGAVEISSPEKIRMQYRLDNVDSEWLDAGSDPHAIYSNVPVGTHALHIRACNRSGIWDRQGVVFIITQRPYFYQTRWFKVAMIALGLLILFLIYRLRVAQISRMLSARFDERLAERTRVAREIHDTLLQTVQGSKFVADHALKNSSDHTRLVKAMEQLSTWLDQATEEGRAALHSLRASTTDQNDLAEAFRRAIDECGRGTDAEISFLVDGAAKEMHPVVRDEVYRIGYEAIRNACAHSNAAHLEVRLEYAHDFMMLVSDNGVGIAAEVIEQGKEGHYGVRGMKERAQRIGAKLSIDSSRNSGTTITLVVPGRVAFRTSAS